MNEKEVLLPFGRTIYQSEFGQGITTDTSNLVSEILKNHSNENKLRVLELGSGNGIISIMLAENRKNWFVIGIEIQSRLVNLANANKKKLNLSNVQFLEADLNRFVSLEKFDLIVSNPPYYPLTGGRISPVLERAISRHEIKTNMKKILECININLAEKGYAYIIYPQNREKDFMQKIKNIDLKPIEKKIISRSSKLMLFVLKKEIYGKD